MNFDTFFSDLVSTVVGGIILALLFFVAKEKLFPLPKLAGRWYFETRTTETTYKPYSGMVLRYVALLWQEGSVVRGSVEKVYESSSAGEKHYVGPARTRGTIDGFVEKYYLSRDRVKLHLVEDGKERTSTVFFELIYGKTSEMIGSFHSMAAEQNGTVRWRRESFPSITAQRD